MDLTTAQPYYFSTAYNSTEYSADERASCFVDQVPVLAGGNTSRLNAYHLEPLEGSDLIGGSDFDATSCYEEAHHIKPPFLARSIRPPRSYLRAEKLKASRYALRNQASGMYWLNLIAFIGISAAIFGMPIFFIILTLIFLFSKIQTWEVVLDNIKFCGGGAIIGYVTYRIFNYIASILPDKSSNYFDRRTGMITFSRNLGKQKKEICFADCDPYLFVDNTTAFNPFVLYVNRYTGQSVNIPCTTVVDVYLLIAYLHQFMDISKPLPDVPELEAYRDQDPVTVAYDKTTNRAPRYWRDMSLEGLKEKVEEKRKKLRFWFGKDMVSKSD